jgi:PTS system N-acetylglucosamine-specific IIC component
VTEPIEFTFIFLAPVLYAVHALLTGVAFIIMNALHVRLGFGFSAGLFDYVLNFSRATRPLWLLPVGVLYFALYYGLFRWFIVRFDLKTPGRDALESAAAALPAMPAERARLWISALGGAANLVSVDACTTRLRLLVADQAAVDEGALKRLGVRGLVRPSANALQVVVGANADQVAGEIRSALHGSASAAAVPAAATTAAAPAPGTPALATPAPDAGALLAALGGRANVLAVEAAASRLRVSVGDAALVDRAAIRGLGLRGVAIPEAGCVHVIVGPAAGAACAALRRLLG